VISSTETQPVHVDRLIASTSIHEALRSDRRERSAKNTRRAGITNTYPPVSILNPQGSSKTALVLCKVLEDWRGPTSLLLWGGEAAPHLIVVVLSCERAARTAYSLTTTVCREILRLSHVKSHRNLPYRTFLVWISG